jgi:hypothetical protein
MRAVLTCSLFVIPEEIRISPILALLENSGLLFASFKNPAQVLLGQNLLLNQNLAKFLVEFLSQQCHVSSLSKLLTIQETIEQK